MSHPDTNQVSAAPMGPPVSNTLFGLLPPSAFQVPLGPSSEPKSAFFEKNSNTLNFSTHQINPYQVHQQQPQVPTGPELYNTGVALQEILPKGSSPVHVLPPRTAPPQVREINFSTPLGDGLWSSVSPAAAPEAPTGPTERSQTLRGIWGQDKGELEALDPDLKKAILRHLRLPKWDGEPKSFHMFHKMFLVWYKHFSPKVDADTLARCICAALPEKMKTFYEACHFHHNWGYTQIWEHLCTQVSQVQPEFFHVNSWESLQLPPAKGYLEYSTWYAEWLLLLGQSGPQLAATVKRRWLQALESHGGYGAELKKVYKREVTTGTKLSQLECHKIVVDYLLSEFFTSSLQGQAQAGSSISAAFARGPHNPRNPTPTSEATRGRSPSRPKEGNCHQCGKPGHWAQDCPDNRCKNCGAQGHWHRECPKPDRRLAGKDKRSSTPSGEEKKWGRKSSSQAGDEKKFVRSRSNSRGSAGSQTNSPRRPSTTSPGRSPRHPHSGRQGSQERPRRKFSGDRNFAKSKFRTPSPHQNKVYRAQGSEEPSESSVSAPPSQC